MRACVRVSVYVCVCVCSKVVRLLILASDPLQKGVCVGGGLHACVCVGGMCGYVCVGGVHVCGGGGAGVHVWRYVHWWVGVRVTKAFT